MLETGHFLEDYKNLVKIRPFFKFAHLGCTLASQFVLPKIEFHTRPPPDYRPKNQLNLAEASCR